MFIAHTIFIKDLAFIRSAALLINARQQEENNRAINIAFLWSSGKLKTRTNLLQDEWFGFLQPFGNNRSANKHLILPVGLVNGLR